jgi:hypothetical protein
MAIAAAFSAKPLSIPGPEREPTIVSADDWRSQADMLWIGGFIMLLEKSMTPDGWPGRVIECGKDV